MRTPMIASLLLLTALAAGCGSSGDGDEESDTSADEPSSQAPSTEEEPELPGESGEGEDAEFCEAFSAIGGVEDFDQARKPFEELAEVGVPEGAPKDAAEGLEIFVGVLQEADDEKELNRLGEEVPQAGQQKVAAFFRYGTEACLAAPQVPAPEDAPTG